MSVDILSRAAHCQRGSWNFLTPAQELIDGAVGHFVDQASDPRCLAALTAGGMAYRIGKLTVMRGMSAALSDFPTLLQVSSSFVGLAAESATFLKVSQILRPSSPSSFLRDFSSTFLTFGLLRGGGFLTQGQNIFLQHLFTDVAMVGGHNLSAALHLSEKPFGSLAEQFVQAEALTWQMKAGLSLSHRIMPTIAALERSLDLSLQGGPRGFNAFEGSSSFAYAGLKLGRETTPLLEEDPTILMMSKPKGGDPPEGASGYPYREVDPELRKMTDLFSRAEQIRERMMGAVSEEEKGKILEEYVELSESFPRKNLPESYAEFGRWSPYLLNGANENGPFILGALRAVTQRFVRGNYQVYGEAARLCNLFGQAKTQQGRFRILKTIEILADRFGQGDPEVYENAAFIRGQFRNPSIHTQRQALETYRALVGNFEKGHKEVVLADRDIHLLYEDLDPKTQNISRETIAALEKKLPLHIQFKRFGRRWLNLSFLKPGS